MITDFNLFKICDHLISEVNEDGEIVMTDQANKCLMCKNSNYYFDYQADSQGASVFIDSSNKPKLDVFKLLNTKRGDNFFQKNYGLTTEDLIGEKMLTSVLNRGRKELVESCDYLLLMQNYPTYQPFLEDAQTIREFLNSNLEQIAETTAAIDVTFSLMDGSLLRNSTVIGES